MSTRTKLPAAAPGCQVRIPRESAPRFVTAVSCSICRTAIRVAATGIGDPDPTDVAELIRAGWSEDPFSRGFLCPQHAAQIAYEEDAREAEQAWANPSAYHGVSR